jgi:hypothetical protein
MTRDEATAAIAKHGSQRAAAKALGCARKTIVKALARRDTPDAGAPDGKRLGKTLAEFRNTYDKDTIVPAKLKAAIRSLGTSGWEYEVPFARAAGVSLTDLAAFRDQFAEFIVPLRDSRRAWAGSKATAQQMRAML